MIEGNVFSADAARSRIADLERERNEAQAHAATLRAALEEVKAEYEAAGMQDEARRTTYLWSLTRIYAALAATPEQSLEAIRAEARREALHKALGPNPMQALHVIRAEARLEAWDEALKIATEKTTGLLSQGSVAASCGAGLVSCTIGKRRDEIAKEGK